MWESQKLRSQGGLRRRVLVVDDDELQLRALRRAHRNTHDFEILTATNAIDALIMIGAAEPDLVVMDVFMPGIDGVEACRRIKSNPATRRTDVILASIEMTPALQAISLAAGAEQAISKPYDLKSLTETPKQTQFTADAPGVMTQPTRGADLLVSMLASAG